jgi:hypothetical protein
MKRPIILAVLAVLAIAATATVAPVAFVGTAQAQVPPRHGAWGDRDRDGIPNRYDNRDSRGAWNQQRSWDRDRDGVPNRYDNFDNRLLRDRDHDGVPRIVDRNDHNPYRQ